MPNESNVRQLLDHGVPIYPITDKSLVLGLQDAPFEYYVVAWDGASTPVPANIPAGVVVTYNGTDYTGTLAAGSATAPYLYLVASASQPGEYDRYITTHPGSSYVWTPLGSTAPVSPVIADDLVTNDSSKALSAKQGKILNDKTSELEAKVDNYKDDFFLAIANNFNNFPNVADFSSFDGTDVISLVGTFTASYDANVITATKTSGGGGAVAFNLAKLNLITGEKYFIAVRRTGEKSKTTRMFIYRGTTASSTGGLVTTLKRSAEFLYGTFVASSDRFLSSETFYSETTIEYEVYLCKLSEIEKFTEMAKDANVVSKSNEAILSDGLGLDGNAAEFSGYSDASVIYNPAGKSVSFSGNEIIVTNTYPAGNGYIGISLDGIGLIPGEHYYIRLYGNVTNIDDSIRKDATASFIGTEVASFSLKDGYILADFVAQAGLTLTLFQSYQREISILSAYISKEYALPANLTEEKSRENFANQMDWVALDGSSTGVSAVKGEDGAVVAASGSGNSIAVFSLPQLPGGRSYTFRIECSTLIGTQAIKNANGGANRYVFTAENGVYTLVISDYQEYIYPLKLWLLLKYNVTSHNIKFYITDNAAPEERQVVKNEALSGIDEQNFSKELLGRCDFLFDNPTLYKGMDICAFNKGICIGDSLTAGSMNTTDAQGNDGPALQTLRGNAFTVARSYPAKLAKLTGIEITTVAQGGITSYDFYETFKDQDWSGHEFAIIELGRNDVAQPPVGYGTWTEQSVTGFTNIIGKLKTENPGIKIFVCNDTNIVGNKELWDLIDGIEQLVSDLNDPDVILLDMHKYGRLNSSNAYQCGHLTQYGYYRLAQDYCNYISWYMAMHKDEFRFIQFIGTNYVYTKEF